MPKSLKISLGMSPGGSREGSEEFWGGLGRRLGGLGRVLGGLGRRLGGLGGFWGGLGRVLGWS